MDRTHLAGLASAPWPVATVRSFGATCTSSGPPLIWDQWKSNDEPPTHNHTIVLVACGVLLARIRNVELSY